jgi:hypothetical protein
MGGCNYDAVGTIDVKSLSATDYHTPVPFAMRLKCQCPLRSILGAMTSYAIGHIVDHVIGSKKEQNSVKQTDSASEA